MNKFWIIFKREYITRVRKRSFILSTFLTPIAMALFGGLLIFLMSYNGDNERHVALIDQIGLFNQADLDSIEGKMTFDILADNNLAQAEEKVESGTYDAVLFVPALDSLTIRNYEVQLYTDKDFGLDETERISNLVKSRLRAYKMDALDVDPTLFAAVSTSVEVNPEPIAEGGKDSSSLTNTIGAMVGIGIGIVIYMAVLIYGMMVMRSVMEEKINRVVEVMISSVKPFELMMGKVLGVAAVGLTQFIAWGLLLSIIQLSATLFLGLIYGPQIMDTSINTPEAQEMMNNPLFTEKIQETIQELQNMNWALILPLFLLYFIGGYLLYASLFAAVGSAINEDQGEAQALTVPISIPVAISFYIAISAIRSPHSPLAVWASIIPLSSPIVMPARLPFDPPAWQIILSIVFLALGIAAVIWLAARIYRVGILMYGKKVSIKDLGKWIFMRV